MRDIARQLLDISVQSLAHYRDKGSRGSGGYYHVLTEDRPQLGKQEKRRNKVGEYSKASTATVVHFLVATDRWCDEDRVTGESVEDHQNRQKRQAERLLRRFVKDEPWTSAKLPDDNAFTVGFLLELAGDLCDMNIKPTRSQLRIITAKLAHLQDLLTRGRGAIAVEPGLENSYNTQLVMRVLRSWDDRLRSWHDAGTIGQSVDVFLDQRTQRMIRTWAMRSIDTEIACYTSSPSSLDVFELGYATMLVLNCTPTGLTSTERGRVIKALELVFDSQLEDGSWPRGRRLFHYPLYGNAYCYDYEFLTQLLKSIDDPLLLRPYLAHFRKAIDRLLTDRVRLPVRSGLDEGYGWLSEHHPQLSYPESWPTASCFHFVHLLDRFVADAIGDAILHHLGTRPLYPKRTKDSSDFDRLLDSSFTYRGRTRYLKRELEDRLINPVLQNMLELDRGKRFSKGAALSAILYGPPGTSKTTYVSAIAAKIGWPLIGIDPSHLVTQGISNIFAQVNELFEMLEYAERAVVFFDEIDELVRNRAGLFEDPESRFLTTAMLPKIANLRSGRRVLFFVATNHLEIFDAAIARPGRFDLIVPVMPPTAESKLDHWPSLEGILHASRIRRDDSILVPRKRDVTVDEMIMALTYDECEGLVSSLDRTPNLTRTSVTEAIKDAYMSCLMCSRVEVISAASSPSAKGTTWETLLRDQEVKIRLD